MAIKMSIPTYYPSYVRGLFIKKRQCRYRAHKCIKSEFEIFNLIKQYSRQFILKTTGSFATEHPNANSYRVIQACSMHRFSQRVPPTFLTQS